MKYQELTRKIIRAFYNVYNALGYGFLENVYENALALELRQMSLEVVCQQPISGYYKGEVVGEYLADMVVGNCVMVELKAVRSLAPEHEAQLLNYLNATSYEVGLLFNFGPDPLLKRKIFDNERKQYRAPKDE